MKCRNLIFKLIMLTAVLVGLSIFFAGSKASAACAPAIALFPDPGPLPTSPDDVGAYLRNANCYNETPAYRPWLALESNPTETNVPVAFGQSSVRLGWRNIGTVGWKHDNPCCGVGFQNGWTLDNHAKVQSVTASGPQGVGIANLSTDFLPLNGFNDNPGFTAQGIIGFDLVAPGSGFTVSGDYTVHFTVRTINHFHKTSGPDSYICVGGTEPPTTADNFAPCPDITVNVTIHITVPTPSFTVTVHVFEVDSAGNNIGEVGGATIESCTAGQFATASNGFTSFNRNQDEGYCVRVVGGGPSGPDWEGPYLRPWSEGYASYCPGYGGPPYTGHCGAAGYSYECQIAGRDVGPQPCGWPDDLDRANDCCFDFVYVKKPKATIQTHVFEVDSSGNFIADVNGATIESCRVGQVSTGADGFGYFDQYVGESYCVRVVGGGPSGPAWEGPYMRPWTEGYSGASCPGYGGPPYSGHCGAVSEGYECQVAGGTVNPDPACNASIDRSWDVGYDFVFVQKPPVNVQAHVFKVDGAGNYQGDVGGATLDTCNGAVVTDGGGFANKSLLPGTGFCWAVTASGLGPQYRGPFIRPWGEAYAGCGPYTFGPPWNNSCAPTSRYDCQVAAGYFNPDACGSNIDRTANDGYDLIYVDMTPHLSCGSAQAIISGVPSDPEAGETFDVRVSFSNNSGGAPITNATYPLVVTMPPGLNPGVYTVPYNPDPLNNGQTATNNAGTLAGVSAPPGQYNINWRVTGAFGSISCNGPIFVASKPYFRAYHGDVYAGGGFDTSGSGVCSKDSKIIGWHKETSPTSGQGAGTQLVALALDSIDNFVSATLRNPAGPTPTQKKGLTLANTGASVDPTWGGDYNHGGSRCIHDYFKDHPTAVDTSNNVIINPAVDETKYYEPGGGTLTLRANPGALNVGRKKAVYVKGNVYITTLGGSIGIDYQNPGGWANISDIPSFILIVSGNIYIDPNVEQLDGFYVAQPNPSAAPDTTGRIYTCADPGGPVSAGSLFDRCNKQLTVNGSFTAYRVKLMRSTSTLRAGVNGEYPGWAAARDCQGSFHDVCAGEIFNFSPELYLANPNLPPTSGSNSEWEYGVSLPPVL